MIKEIKYNGYSASPSDYQSPDGGMASMLNCIPERGALKPILPPETVKSFGEETSVLAIHKVANREHYILYAGTVLTWEMVGGDATDELYDFSDNGGVASVTPIGNTLAVLDSEGTVHYFLWQNNAYKSLGSQLPELNVEPYVNTYVFDRTGIDARFGIKYDIEASNANMTLSGEDLIDTEGAKKLYAGTATSIPLYGDIRQKVYDKVFACLNQFDNALRKDGFFTAPFYVRFAYRLFDGSHAMHTVPFLLVPTTWGMPLAGVRIDENGVVTFDPLFSASKITADISLPGNISSWGDIITHIDVFATPSLVNYTDSIEAITAISQLPFYEYKDNEWKNTQKGEPKMMGSGGHWEPVIGGLDANEGISEYSLEALFDVEEKGKCTCSPGLDGSTAYYALDASSGAKFVKVSFTGIKDFPALSDEEKDNLNLPLPGGNFKVYKIDETVRLRVKDGDTTIRKYVTTSVSDYATTVHHYVELKRTDEKSFAEVLVDYNNFYRICELDLKLNPEDFPAELPIKKEALVNITTQATLSNSNQARSQNIISQTFAYNNRLNFIVQSEMLPTCASLLAQNPAAGDVGTFSIERAYVKVVENAQTSYYRLPDEQSRALDLKIVYFAYPKATAVELEVFYSGIQGNSYVRTIPLTRHPFLNLAYAFNMFDEIEGVFSDGGLLERPQTPILYGNKIKTSNANNPFVFSEENTSELPVGKILALSTAAKALSQGQFGQFPLYAFTDEGIWALEVTGTGTYSARQPITKDVVLSLESVTQLDDAVLFATEQGIMLLSGSQVQCISEVLDGTTFDITQLEFAYKKISEDSKALDTVSWDTYRANIQMLYDYTGQRIIVFNPDYAYSYVFSLDSKQWGIMESNIKSTVNYYPRAYAMTDAGDLVDYSSADEDFAEGYYITRPLKLDAPDVHKTITGIIQRGQFKKGHVNTMLYGSRDLEKWYPVYGSNDHILRGMRGTPYKYFRIASTFHLECDESITGCSVDYEPRLNNKLR